MSTELSVAFNGMFSQMTKNTLESSPCRIDVSDFITRLRKKEALLTLDIRTEEELMFTRFIYGDVLNISMEKLFLDESLDKLDNNKEIIALCHTGARAIAVTTALNMLGYKSMALQGGWAALADYISVKSV